MGKNSPRRKLFLPRCQPAHNWLPKPPPTTASRGRAAHPQQPRALRTSRVRLRPRPGETSWKRGCLRPPSFPQRSARHRPGNFRNCALARSHSRRLRGGELLPSSSCKVRLPRQQLSSSCRATSREPLRRVGAPQSTAQAPPTTVAPDFPAAETSPPPSSPPAEPPSSLPSTPEPLESVAEAVTEKRKTYAEVLGVKSHRKDFEKEAWFNETTSPRAQGKLQFDSAG